MAYEMDADGERRLEGYFDRIGRVIGSSHHRASFAMYTMGLLSEAERKSMEPIAARATGDPVHASARHQRIHHFIANTSWSDHEARLEAARYAIAELEEREPVVAWVIDDTGFLKQGKHSVGVQRQYTGSAGKTANCQVAVSLSITTRTQHLPIDFAVSLLGFDYGMAIYASDKMWTLDRRGHRQGDPRTAKDIALARGPKAFRRCTWRQGTCHKLSSRFALLRVKVPCDAGLEPTAEWLDGSGVRAHATVGDALQVGQSRTRTRGRRLEIALRGAGGARSSLDAVLRQSHSRSHARATLSRRKNPKRR